MRLRLGSAGLAAASVLAAGAGLSLASLAWAKPPPQSCEGYLVNQGDLGLHIARDRTGGPFDDEIWCNASIDGRLQQRVLTVCALGSRCRIKGYVGGHGVFSWWKIETVSRAH